MTKTTAPIRERITEIIAAVANRNELEITPGALLSEDLGMDSLDLTELVMEIEEKILDNMRDVDEVEADEWRTVSDVLRTTERLAKVVGVE